MESEGESEMDDLARLQHGFCVKMEEPLQWWRGQPLTLPCTAALGLHGSQKI